jgi:glucokinase
VNDVHAGIYGELHLGAARKARHVIGVFIGTGVGGGIVIDRRLHFGASGIAGNIGNYLLHAVHHDDGARKEVLDNIASRTAIAGDAAALAAKRQAPKLVKVAGTDVRDIKSGDIAEAIAQGDKAVEKLVRTRAGVVGVALSNLIDFINPDMVVLGGGIVEAMPELMRREIEAAVRTHAEKKASEAVKIVVAKLLSHAGTTGAAKFALDMLSSDPPIELD